MRPLSEIISEKEWVTANLKKAGLWCAGGLVPQSGQIFNRIKFLQKEMSITCGLKPSSYGRKIRFLN